MELGEQVTANECRTLMVYPQYIQILAVSSGGATNVLRKATFFYSVMV